MKFKPLKELALLVLSCMSLVAYAHDFEVGGIYYKITVDNEVAVTYAGTDWSEYLDEYTGKLVIPESVLFNSIDYSVTSIGSAAFYKCAELTSVSIPKSVKSIAPSAFVYCDGVTELIFEDGEDPIDIMTSFSSCPIEKLYIGRDLIIHGSPYSPGHNKENLSEVTIGNTVTIISNNAFSMCPNLKIISLPATITSIGVSAFADCTGLTTMTIPGAVKEIKDGAFDGCTSLKDLILEDGTEPLSLGCANDYKSGKDRDLFFFCPIETLYLGRDLSSQYTPFENQKGLIALTIGNSVTSIGSSAFSGCSKLAKIEIPHSVTMIGRYAFSGCASIKEIVFEDGDEILTLGESGVFYDCPIESLYLGRDLEYKYSPFKDRKGLVKLIMGQSVTQIGESAFENCTALTALTIPNGVKTISSKAFSGCTSIKEIIIEDSEEKLSFGDRIFYDSSIEKLYLGRTLSYETSPFSGIKSLNQLTIGNQVISITSSAFENCRGLATVEISNSVKDIGSSAFKNCSGLPSIDLSNSVTYIGTGAFENCTGFTSITIPNSVTNIDNAVFSGCSRVKELVFEDGDEPLNLGCNRYYNRNDATGEGLFHDCPIERVYIGRNLSYNSNQNYGYSPFNSNKSIQEIIISPSVTAIGEYAFRYCRGISSISIPSSVLSIGDNAFNMCDNLHDVIFEDGKYELNLGHGKDRDYFYKPLFNDCPIVNLYVGRKLLYTEKERVYSPFYGNETLLQVSFGNTVSEISPSLLRDCKSLSKVSLSNSIKEICSSAFEGCSELTSIDLGNSIIKIGEAAFKNCTNIKNFVIPSSLQEINNYAFNGCNNIHELIIEDGNETLVLGYNKGYTTIEPYLGTGLFYDCPIEKLYLGRDLEYDDSHAYGNSPFRNSEHPTIKEVVIGDMVKHVGNYLFYGCSTLTSLNLGASLTTIGGNALHGCTGLTELVLPNTVTSIEGYAFKNCIALTEFIIPNSVDVINNGAFSGCSGIRKLVLEDGDTKLDIGYNVDSWKGMFYDCPLRELYLGRDLDFPSDKNSGYSPFCNSDNPTLTYVVVGDLVSSISERTFYDCRALTSIELGSGIESLGYAAFAKCTSLNKILLPNSVIKIRDYAFSECSGLSEISLSNKLKTIDDRAFMGCAKLGEILLPESVTKIGESAFSGCQGLTSVTCMSVNPPTILENTFDSSVEEVATLYVPDKSVEDYKTARFWQDFYDIQGVTSGIDDVFIDDENDFFENVGSDTEVELYNLNGMMIYKGARSGVELPKGFYIIHQGKTVAKIYIE